jgi:GNAT superfamily N-acetyltransferase
MEKACAALPETLRAHLRTLRGVYLRRREWRRNFQKHPDAYLFLLAEHKGIPVGMLIASQGPDLFTRQPAAQCLVLYVEPDRRGGKAAIGLLRAFHRWAAEKSATTATMNVTSGIRMRQTDRFLRKRGYQLVGGNYQVQLQSEPAGMYSGGRAEQ